MQRGAAAAGFAAVMLLTGCSLSGDESAGTTTSQDARPSNLFTIGAVDGATSTVWRLEKAERTPVELYGVFRRSKTSREIGIAPPCAMVNASEERGEPIPGQTRILLRGVGRDRYTLVAQPMTNDRVALGLSPEGGASCGAEPMTADGLILAAQTEGDDAVVYGMVGDGIVSVDVVVEGVRHHARLDENGFAAQIPDALEKAVEKLVLVRKDGSKVEFPSD